MRLLEGEFAGVGGGGDSHELDPNLAPPTCVDVRALNARRDRLNYLPKLIETRTRRLAAQQERVRRETKEAARQASRWEEVQADKIHRAHFVSYERKRKHQLALLNERAVHLKDQRLDRLKNVEEQKKLRALQAAAGHREEQATIQEHVELVHETHLAYNRSIVARRQEQKLTARHRLLNRWSAVQDRKEKRNASAFALLQEEMIDVERRIGAAERSELQELEKLREHHEDRSELLHA